MHLFEKGKSFGNYASTNFYHLSLSVISIAAQIGEGILLDHGTGVVIGETAVVGNRVSMMHVSQFLFSFLFLIVVIFVASYNQPPFISRR